MKDTLLLGYELGTGRAVRVPVRHMAVTGITQQSGKTTTLEALVGRSGLRAVTFVTKRGEGSFGEGAYSATNRLPAFLNYGEACDWQTVTALLEAYLEETLPKTLRPYLMKACAGLAPDPDAKPAKSGNAASRLPAAGAQPAAGAEAVPPKTLAEVAANLARMEAEADGKGEAQACFVLHQYFQGLLPELAKLPTSTTLELRPGLNIMDLSAYSTALQGLVIGSVLEWIAEHETGVITLIPEAWEFIPREGNTPCKQSVVRLARKGGCIGNFIWLDSQDLAGVDIEVRKMVSVYLLGVQREANEVRRTLQHIPKDRRRPSEREIMQLEVGWFYASFDRELYCTYAQPAWLDADPERARRYAAEPLPASYVAKPKGTKRTKRQTAREGNDGAGNSRALAVGSAPEPLTGSVQ